MIWCWLKTDILKLYAIPLSKHTNLNLGNLYLFIFDWTSKNRQDNYSIEFDKYIIKLLYFIYFKSKKDWIELAFKHFQLTEPTSVLFEFFKKYNVYF